MSLVSRATVLFACAVAALFVSFGVHAQSVAPNRVEISGGSYPPFYPSEEGQVTVVTPFLLDVMPVTNAQYRAFVTANPRWAKEAVAPLFADEDYLKHWSEAEGSPVRDAAPVTNVSWFAARAYCAWAGGRLPTEAEWELVARADESRVDATDDPDFLRRILAFYSRPRNEPADVGESTGNVWGLHDLHGLIWEWVEDFNSSLVSSDNRQSNDAQNNRFCGGAALTAEDTREYATFMRFAFRSSLQPSYAVHNLGFRCAADISEQPQ